MTRQQVAKRLGKSLATVRRLEGVRLRPVQDGRGVHRFDPAEVEALASDIEAGQVALWQELGPTSGDRDHTSECADCADLKERIESERSNHQRELASLQADHERQIARYDADARALVAQVAELLAGLEE